MWVILHDEGAVSPCIVQLKQEETGTGAQTRHEGVSLVHTAVVGCGGAGGAVKTVTPVHVFSDRPLEPTEETEAFARVTDAGRDDQFVDVRLRAPYAYRVESLDGISKVYMLLVKRDPLRTVVYVAAGSSPTVARCCARCRLQSSFVTVEQRSRSDEPSTTVTRCTACGHKSSKKG